MNRAYFPAIALAVAAAASGSAFAEIAPIDNTPFQSTFSRAQVKADLAQYKAAGVNPWSRSYNPLSSFKSTQTREAVTAEYVANRDVVKAFTGEDSGSAYLSATRTAKQPVRHLAGTPLRAE
jgi:hypothetical protein